MHKLCFRCIVYELSLEDTMLVNLQHTRLEICIFNIKHYCKQPVFRNNIPNNENYHEILAQHESYVSNHNKRGKT